MEILFLYCNTQTKRARRIFKIIGDSNFEFRKKKFFSAKGHNLLQKKVIFYYSIHSKTKITRSYIFPENFDKNTDERTSSQLTVPNLDDLLFRNALDISFALPQNLSEFVGDNNFLFTGGAPIYIQHPHPHKHFNTKCNVEINKEINKENRT